MSAPTNGPRTESGRALLEMLSNLAADLPLEFGDEPLERLDMVATAKLIAVIEAEAHERSAGAAPVSKETRAVPTPDDPESEHCYDCGSAVSVVWTAPDHMWSTVTGRPDGGGLLCVRCFDKRAEQQGVLLRWVPHYDPDERSAGAAPSVEDAVVGRGNPWQFFTEHPLPWEVSRTSAGVAIEDANNEVLWRFDHFDSATPEAFAKALNAVVSVEEVPYIRGYNVGWGDAEAIAAEYARLASEGTDR